MKKRKKSKGKEKFDDVIVGYEKIHLLFGTGKSDTPFVYIGSNMRFCFLYFVATVCIFRKRIRGKKSLKKN